MQKIILSLLTIFLMCNVGAQDTPYKSGRYSKVINSDWTFNYFPDNTIKTGMELNGLDDSQWPVVAIPHTWQTFETTGEVHPFIRSASEKDNSYWWTGWGWYRKHIVPGQNLRDKKIFIEFEGVQKYCKVWINGNYLGDHKGGYGSFDFDLTPFIKFGEDNLIAVAVNNKMNDPFRIPPMAAGNFDVYGGIYRDVTLVIKENLYIPMQGSASHEGGTFVTTPSVSTKAGTVRVQTWVQNDGQVSRKATLKTSVIDATGKIAGVRVQKTEIKPGKLFKFDQTFSPISNPRLWSPDDPYLYRVVSELSNGKTITDTFESPLGFRWFWWDYKEDFLYLNGEKVTIHGGNRHQEFPWLGDAIPKWITEKDFYDMAVNLNYNFMRTAHYPNDKLVYSLTDKYGILIDEESPSIKNQVFSPEVQEQQMKEMIRRDRNHPSIILWSMGNETNHAVDSRIAVAEDTTRILTARRVTEGSAGQFVKHTDENLSIENLLRCTIRGWYNKDVKDLEPSDSQHSGTEEHQMNMLKKSGRFGNGNLCTWLYEDHGADREYVNAPLLHINPKGYVDAYRVPKYAYYFWQANYAKMPVLFILPHFWRSQYLNLKKDITVNSNCDTVELFVNGKSVGTLYPDKSNFHSVTFQDILVQEGELSATGRKDGKIIKTSLNMAGEPAKITLTTSAEKITAQKSSVVLIMADIVDVKGVHIYGASNSIKWSVTGPATLIGPENYDTDIDKHHSMEGTMYTDMPVGNLIRSTGQAGTIRVTVSAAGLASGIVELEALPQVAPNSVIMEPVPEKAASRNITNSKKSVTNRLDLPMVLKYSTDEFSLGKRSATAYHDTIRKYVIAKNPGLNTGTAEFERITDIFTKILSNNEGRLIADDYNFSVDHFNSYMMIAGYIDDTALPQLFKAGLKEFYAENMISQGMDKDLKDEKEWIKSIPVTGTIVIANTENLKNTGEVYYTTVTGLKDIAASVYKTFKDLPEEEQAEFLDRIDKLNPYITSVAISNQSREGAKKKVTVVNYQVEKDKPLWFPELKTFKNSRNE